VTPCGVVGRRRFKGPCRLHRQGDVEAVWTSDMLVSHHNTTWRHNSEDLDLIFTAVKTLNLALCLVTTERVQRAGFDFWQGQGFLVFPTALITAVGPTNLLSNGTGDFSPEGRSTGVLR